MEQIELASWDTGILTVDRNTGETSDRIDQIYDMFDPLPREHRVFQGRDLVSNEGQEERRIYHYRGPRMDVHGRGFLGFSTVIAWEPARQAETVIHYDLETMQGALVPFAFLPKSVEQAVVMDAGPKVARLSRTETVYQVDDLHGGKTHFVHPASFTTLEWEEDVTVTADEQAERQIGAIDGADDHNALRVRHGSSTYDGFGNLLEDTVTTVGGVERRALRRMRCGRTIG
ncbi:MAG: hypothetical protein U0359_03300 [Byssovorax sp.]